jgi:hypothetical protein
MTIRHLIVPVLAVLMCGTAYAAEGEHKHKEGEKKAAAVEHATVTGTVTAVNAEKKSFTLKDDASGEADDYRAYMRSEHKEELVKKIGSLKVGDRLEVTYTEGEGRRAMEIKEAAKKK